MVGKRAPGDSGPEQWVDDPAVNGDRSIEDSARSKKAREESPWRKPVEKAREESP